jgi:large subunit ribosomal protein L17
MRHANKNNHLGRTASHRRALLANLACSLIEHKRISTTLAKAKELRRYVEPLITKSKSDTTHSRRTVFAVLQNKEVVKELFSNVSEKVAERQGGYTRILKLGFRPGDNAEIAMIELVDFNELAPGKASDANKKRRRRSKKKAGETTAAAPAAQVVAPVVAPAVVETPAAPEVIAESIEDVVPEVEEGASDEGEKA